MVQIAAIWILSVIVFFALWALVTNLIRKFSERNAENKELKDENEAADKINQQNIQQ